MNTHKREMFERAILGKFRNIRILEPTKDFRALEGYKDSSFGFSIAAAALYANGFNPRGFTKVAPLGLIYDDGKTAFLIGYFRKQEQEMDENGYVMAICPKGSRAIEKTAEILNKILDDADIPCSGVYARFLNKAQRDLMLSYGFNDISASPWDKRAPQEDETYCHSILSLPKVIALTANKIEVLDLEHAVDKEHKRKSRLAYKRFVNFIRRNKLDFTMRKFDSEQIELATGLVCNHFSQLRDAVGSMAEDYFGILTPQVLGLPTVHSYIGYLNDLPISVFVGEELGAHTLGLYLSITSRNKELVLSQLGINADEMVENLPDLIKIGEPEMVKQGTGFSAIPLFIQIAYFAKMLELGIHTIKLGGSETKDLDDMKRQLGVEPDPTYWVVKQKCNQ